MMMKKLLVFLLVALMAAVPALAEEAAGTPAQTAAPAQTPATLTVQGSATVTLEADWAQVTLGVVTLADTVDEASASNAAALQAVVDALTASGIATGDMVTDSYDVSAQYDYQYGKIGDRQTITGYQVSNMLRVSVRQLDQLGSVIDLAMKAGANECYGVSFESTKAAEAGDQALTLAVAEGARKASLTAQASGKTLGRLTEIVEQPESYQGVTLTADAVADSAGTTILADGLSFSATVTMTYELN